MIYWALKLPVPNKWVRSARKAHIDHPQLKDTCERVIRMHLALWATFLVMSPVLIPMLVIIIIWFLLIKFVEDYGSKVLLGISWVFNPVLRPIRAINEKIDILIHDAGKLRDAPYSSKREM